MKKAYNSNFLLIRMILSLSLFLITYFFVLANLGGPYNRDFLYHSEIAQNFSFGNIRQEVMSGNTYFMWHALVSLLYHYGNVSLPSATAVVTALANILTLNFVLEYLKRKAPTTDNGVLTYLGCGVFFVGPLFLPWINPYYYLGTWSPNAWHNPTNNMVRPFTVLTVILMLEIIENQEKKFNKHIILSVVLALSVIAKPSLLQGIAPAIALYVLVEIMCTKKINWKKWIPLAVAFIPAVCIMMFQLWLTFYSGNTLSEGIGVEYLRVLNYYTNNAYVSLLACILFPIFVIVVAIIIQRKDIFKNSRVVFAVCYLVVSWLEMAVLYEKGAREKSANFAWAYMLAVFITWFLCILEFLDIIQLNIKHKRIVTNIGIAIFSTHLLMGIWYLVRIFQNIYYG